MATIGSISKIYSHYSVKRLLSLSLQLPYSHDYCDYHTLYIVLLPTFLVNQCAFSLAPPSYGNVECTDGRKVGSECTFSCTSDYLLHGTSSRICTESGNSAYWSGSDPNCTGNSDAEIRRFKAISYFVCAEKITIIWKDGITKSF